jgi:hypothetical protein
MKSGDGSVLTRRNRLPQRPAFTVPAMIVRAGDDAASRFREFFLQKRAGPGRMRARATHYKATRSFFQSLERRGITELAAVAAYDLSLYLDELYATARPAVGVAQAEVSVRQHRRAIRMLFEWLADGKFVAPNLLGDHYRAASRARLNRLRADPIFEAKRLAARSIPPATRSAIIAGLMADPNASRVAKQLRSASYNTVLKVAKAAGIKLGQSRSGAARRDQR